MTVMRAVEWKRNRVSGRTKRRKPSPVTVTRPGHPAVVVEAGAFGPTAQTAFARRLAALGFSSYREYVKSPDWITRREAWYEQNGKWCRVCECPAPSMVLHHRTYANLGNEADSDLVALCGECHGTVHRIASALRLGLGQAVRHVQRLRRMDGY